MTSFQGFPEGKVEFIPVPRQFFEELLLHIDHPGELKLTLYVFWRLTLLEGSFRYLRRSDFLLDKSLITSLGGSPGQEETVLDEALQSAEARGILLRADLEDEGQPLFFLNSARGRAALRAIEQGQWKPAVISPASPVQQPPNIYRLYEENIGPLTPMLAEALREAEDTYPAVWIEDAIRIAMENNKRSWRYVAAILERWQREGRDAQKTSSKDRRDSTENRRRYIEGEFSDFVEQ